VGHGKAARDTRESFVSPRYYILEFACDEGERDLQHYTEDTGKKQK